MKKAEKVRILIEGLQSYHPWSLSTLKYDENNDQLLIRIVDAENLIIHNWELSVPMERVIIKGAYDSRSESNTIN